MSLISSIYVPDEGPTNAKILFVGEAPGESEEQQHRPFIGDSGDMLMTCLGRMGVSREEVRLANLCHYRPQGNKFEHLIGTPQLESGIQELHNYIAAHPPNIICCLGKQSLNALTGKSNIHAWRGSILSGPNGVKTVPTFHPAYVLRDRTLYPIFDTDIRRVVEDSKFPELNLPERRFIVAPRGLELEECVEQLCNAEKISVDIETSRKGDKGTKYLLCIGFSSDPSTGICIPNDGSAEISNAYARILSSQAKKIFHFGTFDVEALHLNGYNTNNYWWDTLTAQHILNAELPRGLDFLTSIYTREPYYKAIGRAEIPSDTKEWGSKIDHQQLYIYNCRDACTTLEIQMVQETELEGRDLEMFHYEMSLIPVGLSMSRNGMLCDIERRKQFEQGLYHRWVKLQVLMNQLTGKEINVRSPKLKDLLYGDFKLPVRRNREGGITADEDAIVSLLTYVTDHINNLKTEKSINEWRLKSLILKAILEIRGIRQLLSNYVKSEISYDDRFRSVYKFSSTETGRAACEKYIDNSGVNAQTFPRGIVDVPENLTDTPTFDLGEGEDETE